MACSVGGLGEKGALMGDEIDSLLVVFMSQRLEICCVTEMLPGSLPFGTILYKKQKAKQREVGDLHHPSVAICSHAIVKW